MIEINITNNLSKQLEFDFLNTSYNQYVARFGLPTNPNLTCNIFFVDKNEKTEISFTHFLSKIHHLSGLNYSIQFSEIENKITLFKEIFKKEFLQEVSGILIREFSVFEGFHILLNPNEKLTIKIEI